MLDFLIGSDDDYTVHFNPRPFPLPEGEGNLSVMQLDTKNLTFYKELIKNQKLWEFADADIFELDWWTFWFETNVSGCWIRIVAAGYFFTIDP